MVRIGPGHMPMKRLARLLPLSSSTSETSIAAEDTTKKASEGILAACCSTSRVNRFSPCSARKTGADS